MSSRILQVESLTIGTNSGDIVSDLSFYIDQNEIVALTGRSGSGKTSVALAILNALNAGLYLRSGTIQFLTPDGTLYLLPNEAGTWHIHRGKNIGFIPQDVYGAFDPVIKMGKQISMIIKERKSFEHTQIATSLKSALHALGIQDADRIINSYPHQLSGGQLQRCLLAMAMVMKPALIIADEPTSAVDKIHQQELFEALRLIRDKYGIAILCITHDRSVVKDLANREIQLDNIHSSNNLNELYHEHPNSNSGPILEVKDISFLYTYGGIVKQQGAHIKGISFKIEKGECLGILGESGSGKSTIAQLLVGLIRPASGEMIILGSVIDFNDRNDIQFLRSKVQLVMQDGRGSLHPYKSIRYLLTEVVIGDLYSEIGKDDAIQNALQEVGLPLNVLDRTPSELSGGECFRVSIARALLKKPDLLICDESTAALDTYTRDEILKLLSKLREELELALILISHDDAVITGLADKIMVIAEGEVVEVGERGQMLEKPTHPLTKKILSRPEKSGI